MSMEKDINDFTLVTNIGLQQNAYDNKCSWQSSFNTKYEVNEHLECFAEYFAQFQKNDSPLHNVDAGIVFFITKKIATHIAYGTSFLTHQYNRFANTGIAFQL